ncbi:MAG: glutamate synthase subunit beta [Phycisphaerae bacterium]
MAKPTGFLEYVRQTAPKRPVAQRVRDWREVEGRLPEVTLREQAARCMDCGIPFCHAYGCPLANRIPEFNEMVYREDWARALEFLHATNNFPEITGRICPAPCEAACTLSIGAEPVTIRQVELAVAERGWRDGLIRPEPPGRRTGRRAAVVGSGPAGLAASQQLARAGHEVVVFEKHARPGGILRYGIPDFKLEKWVLDRRLDQMRAEGVAFETGVVVGDDVSMRYLVRKFDAVLLAVGAEQPRDLTIPGRGLEGIHFAMDFLVQQNRRVAAEDVSDEDAIRAGGRKVVVIGGGDTGSDCVGTARRQGAAAITQIELLPEPPAERPAECPWPAWPTIKRTSSSHEEGCERLWSVLTKEFIGHGGIDVRALRCVRIDWSEPDAGGRRSFEEVADSEFHLEADLVLLALGFVHVRHGPMVTEAGLAADERGNLKVDGRGMTSREGVFAASDCVHGASLVVRAIAAGRQVAGHIDDYLRGE